MRAPRSEGTSRGAEPGLSGHESPAPLRSREGEGSSGPPPPARPPGARECARAPPARRRRPPLGAAGSRGQACRRSSGPCSAWRCCPPSAHEVGARPLRARNFPRPSETLAAPYARAPGGWERAAGVGRGTGRPGAGAGWGGHRSGAGGEVQTLSRAACPFRGGLEPPAPGPGFEIGFEARRGTLPATPPQAKP